MRRALLVVALAASGGLGAWRLAAAPASPRLLPRLPPAAGVGETVFYGHVRSLAPAGARWRLRFDPAWWLGGSAANQAAVADGAIRPGEAVPNDYYVVDESHRLLVFPVAAKARVTVLDPSALPASRRVTLAELARIVRRGTGFGFWIRVASGYPGLVRSLDQQYQP